MRCVFYDLHWNASRLQKASKAMDCKRRQDWEGEDDCKNCATVPVEKKSRLEWETEVDPGLEHTREGFSGQNIVDQLIKEEKGGRRKVGKGGKKGKRCILVVGSTGNGKTSTINIYTGAKEEVGDSVRSETQVTKTVEDLKHPGGVPWVDNRVFHK